jgi:RNA polymerase sigma-70 factor (ECF subfamily)
MSNYSFLEKLFRRHRMELVAFANLRLVHSEAEDLPIYACCNIRIAPPFRIRLLNKVISNLGFDYHRKEALHQHYHEAEDIELDSLVSPLPALDMIIDGQILLKNCLMVLEALPAVYRHIFLLHRIDGLSHKEITEALQLPQRTVERYCAKALAQCFTATFLTINKP